MGVEKSAIAATIPFDVDENGFPSEGDFVQEAIENARLVKRLIDFRLTIYPGYSLLYRNPRIAENAEIIIHEDGELFLL